MNTNLPDTAHEGEAMPMTTPASSQALASLKEQAEAMNAAMQVAEAMCSTELVPKQYRGKPADGAAAILYGAELGLGAIQSLQQVMVINGKPGVEARTMVALLRNHGYTFDVTEDTSTAVTVVGTSPTGETHTSRWTYEMAEQAGYTKNPLYSKIPGAMLYAKAATEVCRRLGSHILSGIAYSVEELRLAQPVQASSKRMDRRGGARAALSAAASQAAQPEPEPEDAVVEDAVSHIIADLEAAPDRPTITEIMARDEVKSLDGADHDQVSAAANTRWQALA